MYGSETGSNLLSGLKTGSGLGSDYQLEPELGSIFDFLGPRHRRNEYSGAHFATLLRASMAFPWPL